MIYFIPKFFLSDNLGPFSTRQSLSGVSSRFSISQNISQNIPKKSDSVEEISARVQEIPTVEDFKREESAYVEENGDHDNEEKQLLCSVCKSTIEADRNMQEEGAEGDRLPVFTVESRKDG